MDDLAISISENVCKYSEWIDECERVNNSG